MENSLHQDERHYLAQKRVKKIKGFYSHLFFYVVINTIIIIQIYSKTGSGFWNTDNFYTAFFWGIGLLIHGLSVFASNVLFGSDWEKRKIEELMNKDKNKRWE